VTTVVLGDLPELDALLRRRRALGQDKRDEVWEGVYYVVPHASYPHGRMQVRFGHLIELLGEPLGLSASVEANLGTSDDFRVPDVVAARGEPTTLYVATAAIVVEILSPNDQTFAKFGFYAARGVEEVWVADLDERSVRIWELDREGYAETGRSGVLQLTADEVRDRISWP
jgi:Uma2 family endonuclease